MFSIRGVVMEGVGVVVRVPGVDSVISGTIH